MQLQAFAIFSCRAEQQREFALSGQKLDLGRRAGLSRIRLKRESECGRGLATKRIYCPLSISQPIVWAVSGPAHVAERRALFALIFLELPIGRLGTGR